MEEVVLLDYATGEVWIYKLPRLQMMEGEVEDWLDSMGHHLSDCEWMLGSQIIINDERL